MVFAIAEGDLVEPKMVRVSRREHVICDMWYMWLLVRSGGESALRAIKVGAMKGNKKLFRTFHTIL
jgi:hypothetical protein